MKFLAVHPGPLMYTMVFLRLEPLGLALVAAAARRAGHEVRLIDLQVESHEDYFALLEDWRPDAVAFSCNYLANLPIANFNPRAVLTGFIHTVLTGGDLFQFIWLLYVTRGNHITVHNYGTPNPPKVVSQFTVGSDRYCRYDDRNGYEHRSILAPYCSIEPHEPG